MYSKPRKNIYKHEIDAREITIPNCSRDSFCNALLNLPYLMYKVETLCDGREIVLNKPGGKRAFGRVAREDFMVWVHDPSTGMVWLISHKDILDDLVEKSKESREKTLSLIELLERVFKGEEPYLLLEEVSLNFESGEMPELLLKAYKWIWGQEDCNYPAPKYQGREMSMAGIIELKNSLLA